MEMEIDLVDDDSVILVSGEEHRLEGNEHYKKLNYKAALESYTAAINTEPDVALFYSNRSAANLMLLRYRDALNDAKKACYLDNANIKAIIRLCKCYIILGECESAKLELDKAIQLDSKNNIVQDQVNILNKYQDYYAQYQSQNDKGDFRHALHCMDNCLRISNSSVVLKLLRVELLINLKRYTEAKEILEKQLNDEKQNDTHLNTEALFYRGLCLYYLDHLDKAQIHFQHVLKLNPDHKKAQLSYRRCKKLSELKNEGNNLVRKFQYKSARLIYTEALLIDVVHDTLNAKLHFNRALTFLKLGDFKEGLDDCNKALLLDPLYQKVKARRVQCLMGLEQWVEAVREASKLFKQNRSEENYKILEEAKLGQKRSKEIDLYKVLGVTKSASEAELKKGYRKRALAHHPDRHSHADEVTRKGEEQKFKEINTAYSVLSDPRKRQMYDAGADVDKVLGNNGGSESNHGGDNVFHSFYRNSTGQAGQKFKFNFQ